VTAREGHVEWQGRRTWFRVVGDAAGGKDPLVCLHGGPGSTHNYFAPLERLAEDGPERLQKLGLGTESAVTLPEVLPRELPEPLHAQLLQVVHRWSEGAFSTPAPPLTRR